MAELEAKEAELLQQNWEYGGIVPIWTAFNGVAYHAKVYSRSAGLQPRFDHGKFSGLDEALDQLWLRIPSQSAPRPPSPEGSVDPMP